MMIDTTFNDIAKQQAQQSYMDVQGLHKIRERSGEDKELGLRQIAQQFESMFIQMMMKSMRSANDVFAKDNPLNSFEMDFHRDNLDKQLGLSLSGGQSFGLADSLYRQMSRNYLAGDQIPNNTNGYGKETWENRILNDKPQGLSEFKHIQGVYTTQRIEDAKLLKNINDQKDFVDAVAPHAKVVAEKMGVDYKVLVAQSALETGWGKHIIRDQNGNQSFNLFNIKADRRWQGDSVPVSTLEYHQGVAQKEQANFRRYQSIADSFNDYQQFLTQPRYEKAMTVAENSEEFVKELQRAGYATDPQYADKVNRILNSDVFQ